jgi:hypothetical protein
MKIQKHGRVLNVTVGQNQTTIRFVRKTPAWFSNKRGGITTTRLGWFSIQHVKVNRKNTAWVDDGISIPPYPGQ